MNSDPPPFLGVQYTQGIGWGVPRGIPMHERPPGSQAGTAAPPMTFREASGEQRNRRGLKRKEEVGRVVNKILFLKLF